MFRRIPVILGLALVVVPALRPAAAETWAVFREDEFGCRVSYPKHLFTKDPREAGRPARFSGPDEKTFFRIMGAENEEGASLSTLRQKYFGTNIRGEVIYQRATKNFLVLSGYRRERIFYTRVELSPDNQRICILEITYPREKKRAFDQMVTRMSHSFSVQ